MELDDDRIQQAVKKKDRVESRMFVLALLDKRMNKKKLSKNEVCENDITYAQQFIRTSLHYSKYLSCKRGDDLSDPTKRYYVVKKNSMQPDVGVSERLTDFLMGNSNIDPQDDDSQDDYPQHEVPQDEEWTTPDAESYTEKYQASALIFPIEDDKNLALAYLFGNWKVFINHETMDRDFGLRTVASEAMSDYIQGEPLQTIKSATTGMYREENATLNFSKQRDKLGTFSEVNSGHVGSTLEGLRIRPKRDKNSRLVEGHGTFRSYLNMPANAMKRKSYVDYLREKAFERYHDYKDYPVSADFESHVPSYVNPDSKTAEELNNNLDEFWDKYFQRGIITKGLNFWSHVNGVPRKDHYEAIATLNSAIRSGKSTAIVKIGNEELKVSDLIRVVWICLHKSSNGQKFYRLEGGRWYEMAQSFVERMKKAISGQIIRSEDLCLLPIASNTLGKTEHEGIYNENAVEQINAEPNCRKLSALLLDKKMVSLKGHNRFELADILLQTNEERKENQHFYLVHVKKASVDELPHHCQQVILSAKFMADNLDRSAAATTFAKEFVGRLYEELIDKPVKEERFSFFHKKFDKKIILSENKFEEMLDSYVNSRRYKMDMVDHVLEIKDMISNWDEWKEMYATMSMYGGALYVWLDCMVDYVATPRNPNSTKARKVDVMRSSLEKFAGQLEEYELFTKTHGILTRAKKNQITFVLAIITNTPPDKYLIDNKVSMIYDAMRAVEERKFKFKLTFISVLGKEKGRQQKKAGKPIRITKMTTQSRRPKNIPINNGKGKTLPAVREGAKRKALKTAEDGCKKGQVVKVINEKENSHKVRPAKSDQVAPKRKALTTLRKGGNEGQHLAQKRTRMENVSNEIDTLTPETCASSASHSRNPMNPDNNGSGNPEPDHHNTGNNGSGNPEPDYHSTGNNGSGNPKPDHHTNGNNGSGNLGPGKHNQENHSPLGIVGMNYISTVNPEIEYAGTAKTNRSRQTLQKEAACGSVMSQVSIVSVNSLYEMQSTKSLETTPSSSQNITDVKENVGKAAKKSVLQSPKSTGKRGGSPSSKNSIKKQKQAEDERKGRVFMKKWLSPKKSVP